MKILINEKSIRRNARIGSYTSIAALVILAGGMYISFAYQNLINLSFVALVVGFILSQVGIFFGNRWGRHPRVDERLTSALKGLTKDYNMYHFLTPVNHLLVGPAGIWIVEPYYQRGTIVYQKGKLQQKGGGFLLAYLKIFAQEGLGRPDMEAGADLDNMTTFFKKKLGEGAPIPSINAVMVFTDDRVVLETEGSPIPVMKIEQLKEFLRVKAKQAPMSAEDMKQVTALLPQESIE